MKILVISFAGIGDTLLATPLIHALREQFPGAIVDALVRWRGSMDLLEGSPYLNTVFFEQNPLANLRLLWRLRRMRYDISINAHPQSRIEYRLIARIINARKRLSHRYENYTWLDDWLINLSLDQDYGIHCIENSLNLLKLINCQIPEQCPDVEIVLSRSEAQWAEDFLRQQQFEGKTLLAIHAGSGKTKNLILKRWPVKNYIQVIQKVLAREPGLTVLLFGGPEEREANEEILKAVGGTRVIPVPSRTIKEAAALLKRCDLFLSVDNLFMHLAAMAKVPCQIVIESPTFNKTIEPFRRPYRLVRNPMVADRNLDYYRYDGRNVRGTTEHLLACMESVSPDSVFEEVRRALADRHTTLRPV